MTSFLLQIEKDLSGSFKFELILWLKRGSGNSCFCNLTVQSRPEATSNKKVCLLYYRIVICCECNVHFYIPCCDVMWCDLWCDDMWRDMIWYDMMWHDIMQHNCGALLFGTLFGQKTDYIPHFLKQYHTVEINSWSFARIYRLDSLLF